jgi:peptide/nickel transport system substrate-binding protein
VKRVIRVYGEKLQPQRQMVEFEEVSADGLAWTFRLRSGLKFHDGEPVLAKDVVAASIAGPHATLWVE